MGRQLRGTIPVSLRDGLLIHTQRTEQIRDLFLNLNKTITYYWEEKELTSVLQSDMNQFNYV